MGAMNVELDGAEIQRRRQAADLSQDRLGQLVGVSGSAIGQYEKGARPGRDIMALLVAVLAPELLDTSAVKPDDVMGALRRIEGLVLSMAQIQKDERGEVARLGREVSRLRGEVARLDAGSANSPTEVR